MRSQNRYIQTAVVMFTLGVTLSACGLPSARQRGELSLVAPIARAGSGCGTAIPPAPAQVEAALDRLPLYFVENRGQMEASVAYYVQGRDTTVYFTSQGLTFALTEPHRQDNHPATLASGVQPVAFGRQRDGVPPRARWILKLNFVGANPQVQPMGKDLTPAVISYFTGSQAQWRTGLPTYAEVVYPELWPGIDLVYSGTVNQLKYTFVVKPGADPNQIRLAYQGATGVHLTEAGQLAVTTPVGSFSDAQPIAYQEGKGRRTEVPTAYRVEPQERTGSWEYGFTVGDYDPRRELVIDPAVVVYAGYVSPISQLRSGIAVDGAGNAYVTGTTLSTQGTFPVKVGPDLTFNGDIGDAFVAKVSADGKALLYAGYIGGSLRDGGDGIAVDCVGNAYVTGTTESTEATFPVTNGPDLTHNGLDDAFVAKVSAGGTTLLYAGYIGGDSQESGFGIAVDSTGSAYVTGYTNSPQPTFPVTVGPDLTYNGGGFGDAFVAKVNAQGTALSYAGYIGGAEDDFAYEIALDSAGNAYVIGGTSSTQATFPVTVGPDLTFNGGFSDAFVAKVNARGTALTYAGYLGGNDFDEGSGIAVDSAGNAYVTGYADSTEGTFPVKVGPDLTFNGLTDAFVAKVNAQGTALSYAGYIGGAPGDVGGIPVGGVDVGLGIAVDSAGNAYVTGGTSSTEATFPVTVGPDLTFNGGFSDAFVAKVNSAGTALLSAGYLGGNEAEDGFGIAVDGVGNAYMSGRTGSYEGSFPVKVGPDLTFNSGGSTNAFVAKLGPSAASVLHTQVTRSRFLFNDTVFVGGAGQPEWVTLSGMMHLVTEVDVPSSPLSTAEAAQTTADSLAVARISAKLTGVDGVGETTGRRYQISPGPASQFVAPVESGLVEFPKCYELSTVGSKATFLASTQVRLAVDEQGNVSEASAPATLVSWWPAEDSIDDNTAADAQGLNPGVRVGTVDLVSGRVGQAFRFAGSGFVEVADSETLEPPTVTVMAWVRGYGSPGENAYIISKGAEGCALASYALYTGGDGGLIFYVADGATFNGSPDAGPDVWDGVWHLVAGTYDGSVVRLYVDGVEVGAGTEPTIAGINYNLGSNGRFYIGAYRGTCDLGFTGDVDEVQVFSRALTGAELENIYNALVTPPFPDL